MKKLVAIVLLILWSFVSAHAREYRTVEVESLRITIDSDWAPQGAPGYVPVRFDIANLGDERVIEIVGQGERWFGYGSVAGNRGSLDIRQTLRLNRGDRLRLTIPVPAFGESQNVQFRISEDGEVLQTFNYNAFQSGKTIEESAVLFVSSPTGVMGSVASWLRPVPSPYYGVRGYGGRGGTTGAMPRLDFILDPSRLPTNWLGYTSLSAVFIGPQEWEQLTEGQKDALLTWTASGGDIVFIDADENTLLPGKNISTSSHHYFFGRIHSLRSADVNARPLTDTLTDIRNSSQNRAWALPINRAPDWGVVADRGFRLPIPGVDGVPARRYLVILFLFTLLIGPVNYFYLWRRQQQTLLVLTVPLISALFIVVLAGYAVAGEGFGVRGRAETFTMLDQTTKQAATRATVSLYAAGMAPSGGLRFPRDVAVVPLGSDGRGARATEGIDLTESQQFFAGIIQARLASNYEQVAFRPARERLTFANDGGRVSVLNGLGATITQLSYRDGNKIHTLTRRLESGAREVLQPENWNGSEIVVLGPAGSPPLYREKFRNAVQNQPEHSYVAVLDRSPFWEAGVGNIDERGSVHVVLGLTGGEQ